MNRAHCKLPEKAASGKLVRPYDIRFFCEYVGINWRVENKIHQELDALHWEKYDNIS